MNTIIGHNGVRLNVETAGNPADPSILLIHGWSQSALSWAHQLSSLGTRFHIVAPDLRGHGASDKPDDTAAYDSSTPWAGDIAAIIDQLQLEKPLLVGWSMGGWVACDYLRLHGSGALGGLVLVGSAVTTGKFAPPGVYDARSPEAVAIGMFSDDPATNLAATRAFVRACTARPLPDRDFAATVDFNMLVPPHIRKACRTRHEDYRPTMSRLDLPTLVAWGENDSVVLPPMAAEALATIPNARPLMFPGLGHAPFAEDAEGFNAALAEFAQTHRPNTDRPK